MLGISGGLGTGCLADRIWHLQTAGVLVSSISWDLVFDSLMFPRWFQGLYLLNKLQVPECVKDPSCKELQRKAEIRRDKKIFLKKKVSKNKKREREKGESTHKAFSFRTCNFSLAYRCWDTEFSDSSSLSFLWTPAIPSYEYVSRPATTIMTPWLWR